MPGESLSPKRLRVSQPGFRPETNLLRVLLANSRPPATVAPLVPAPVHGRNGSALGLLSEAASAGNGQSGRPPERGLPSLRTVIFGSGICSDWGNNHGITYRGLIRELSARGHAVLFLEREAGPPVQEGEPGSGTPGRFARYADLKQLKDRYGRPVRNADVVMIGSELVEGRQIGEWVTRVAQGATVFHDLDTPASLARLETAESGYLSRALIPKFSLYLSSCGGSVLSLLEHRYGARAARPLYQSADVEACFPEPQPHKWDLGFLGTYTEDRLPGLDELLLTPARHWHKGRFVLGGTQYPKLLSRPRNVKLLSYVPPERVRAFYNAQRFTLNLTRASHLEAGFSPSRRLFEAAACGTPIITDFWEGLDRFFSLDEDILIANSSEDILTYLLALSEKERTTLGKNARARVLRAHTTRHRVRELESYLAEVLGPSLA